MFCSKCGSQSIEGSAFCQKCGAKLITDNTSQHTATSVPVNSIQPQARDTQADKPKKKKSKKLPIILGAVALIIVVIIIAVSSGDKTDYIMTVKAHSPFVSQGYSYTYGTVLNDYIDSPIWEVSKANDKIYVNARGKTKDTGDSVLVSILVTIGTNNQATITPASVAIGSDRITGQDNVVRFLLDLFIAYDGGGYGALSKPDDTSYTTYTSKEHGFSFKYPSDWIDGGSQTATEIIRVYDGNGASFSVSENYILPFELGSGDEALIKEAVDEYHEFVSVADAGVNGRVMRELVYKSKGLAHGPTYVSNYFYFVGDKDYQIIVEIPIATLDDYQSAFEMLMNSYTITDAMSDVAGVFGNVLDQYLKDDTYRDCSYALYDIDGNGVDELLVRYNDGDEVTKLYTYADDKTNEIGEFWSRKRLLLDGKGNIYSEGSNGASSTILELARISDDGTTLIVTETWEMDGSIYSHNSIEGLKVISEKEFNTAWNSISDATNGFVNSLNWQPLSANGNGSGAENSNPYEVLYKGEPIMNWMGARLADLRDVFGAPDIEGIVGEGAAYGFSYEDWGMVFIKREQGEDIESISGKPSLLSMNGTTLDTSRDQLVSLFGNPVYEDWGDEEYYAMLGMDNSYYMTFSLGTYSISFELNDPNGKAWSFLISYSNDGSGDDYYDEYNVSSDPVTADGSVLSVGSLVYAKQSVNYVRGYVTSIDSANSVNVAWDTVLENNLWGFTECAIFSDSYSISGYSYSASSTGTTVQLVGLKFNLSANELYSRMP